MDSSTNFIENLQIVLKSNSFNHNYQLMKHEIKLAQNDPTKLISIILKQWQAIVAFVLNFIIYFEAKYDYVSNNF